MMKRTNPASLLLEGGAKSVRTHYLGTIHFFEKRSANAASESYSAKIKSFRSQFKGVKDKAFFLFRPAPIYA